MATYTQKMLYNATTNTRTALYADDMQFELMQCGSGRGDEIQIVAVTRETYEDGFSRIAGTDRYEPRVVSRVIAEQVEAHGRVVAANKNGYKVKWN